MAASELQERLDYLVSYSSQLIFINGESTDQSRVLDTFISESTEQVEIALLTASPTTPLLKYREKIFRQLVSQTLPADFNRPLNQLLVALNQHNGPLIISIGRAENLPDKLVQELWELVLQSRFANNKQHLNVLLFAQGNWAKQTRNKLHSRSGDKPLLLNHSSALPRLNAYGSELDKLIAHKRQQFSERLQQRAQQTNTQPSLLKRKSMLVMFTAVFLLAFSGILSLQYPVWSLFPRDALKALPVQETVENSQPIAAASLSNQDSIVIPAEPSTALTSVEDAPTSLPETNSQEIKIPAQNTAADPLVTDWQSAIAKIEEQPRQYLLAEPKEAKIASQENTAAPSTTTPAFSQDKQSNVQQAATTKPEPVKTKNEAAASLPVALKPLEPDIENMVLRNGEYLIQISAMSDNYLLQQFMQENPQSQQVWHYTTQRFGGDWHVLIYKHVYPNLDAARAALQQLPQALSSYDAFVKSARQIKQELAQKGV